jgi:hypothetical protein
VLRGTPDRDWLQGEDGDDDLHGGGGDDRYVLGPRFGTTYVFEDGGDDVIQFLTLERRDVVLERDGDDAVLRFPGHGRVHVRDHFRRDAYKVERVEFAAGPPLTREDLDLIGEDDADLKDLGAEFTDRHATLSPAFDPKWATYTATMDLNKRCDLRLSPVARRVDARIEIRRGEATVAAGSWIRFRERDSGPLRIVVTHGTLQRTYSIAIACYPVAP